MWFTLAAILLVCVTTFSNAANDESICSNIIFQPNTNKQIHNPCFGSLNNIQCNPPKLPDDKQCKNFDETKPLLEELIKRGGHKKWKLNQLKRENKFLAQIFQNTPFSPCVPKYRKYGRNVGSMEVTFDHFKFSL